MAYLDHFGLRQEPFSNAPVTQFYFETRQHAEAVAHLLAEVDRRAGLSLVEGERGAGKTTFARRLLEAFPPAEYEAALLVMVHGILTPSWLVNRIALHLGVDKPAVDTLTLHSQLHQRLLEIDAQGRKAVVLIDDAQRLQTPEIIEEFRGFLTLERSESKLLSFVLFGLPGVEPSLTLEDSWRFQLPAFEAAESVAYVEHRMALAGAAPEVFSAQALNHIYDFSRGSPRWINTLCDNALFEAFLQGENEVKGELIERVASRLGLAASSLAEEPQRRTTRNPIDVEEVDRYLDGLEKT